MAVTLNGAISDIQALSGQPASVILAPVDGTDMTSLSDLETIVSELVNVRKSRHKMSSEL